MTQRDQDLEVTDLPFSGKFSLRCRKDAVRDLSQALELDLPTKIGAMMVSGSRRAICLGPDEWLIHCPASERSEVALASAALYESIPHSLVDVSYREIGLSISGREAAELIGMSCPRDLDSIAVGTARRTIFDSAQVILVHPSVETFEMYVWRSFLPHVRKLLHVGKAELATGL